MQACSSAMLVKPKTYVTRRAVAGRAGTSKLITDVGIAVAVTASRLSGRTANGPRKVICGGASGARRRMAWRPSSATTGTGTCARGRRRRTGTRPDLCGYQMSRRISHGPILTSTPSTRRLLDGVTVCRFLTARWSQHGRVHATHWLISTQVVGPAEARRGPLQGQAAQLREARPRLRRRVRTSRRRLGQRRGRGPGLAARRRHQIEKARGGD